jgi:hypothetical protein
MKPQVNKIVLCWNYVGKEWTVFSSELNGNHLQHTPNLVAEVYMKVMEYAPTVLVPALSVILMYYH